MPDPADSSREGLLPRRPAGDDDATVEAAGTVSEALEWVERARGRLYDLHQMIGRPDLLLDGQRHVFESEMKEARRTSGAPRHDSRPEA